MTVVLLNPYRPELIPLQAREVLTGPVLVTEELPARTLWQLDHAVTAVDGADDPTLTLLSSDVSHPLVLARIAAGHRVIAATVRSGEALLDAVELMDTLRRNGPWESAQTHDTLRRYLVEEVYELLDAIATDDAGHLREELGDLLLQVLFHARIAADRAEDPFDIDDVARSFTTKVSHRTPGILSGQHADLETQIREWEERKAAEKKRGSVLDGIATAQPALSLAQKVLERLSAAGYPVAGIDPKILHINVWVGDDSVEDVTRRKVLTLMEQVRSIESRAAHDGVALDSPEAWLRYLDAGAPDRPSPRPTASPHPTPAAEPAPEPVGAAENPTPPAADPTLEDADVVDVEFVDLPPEQHT